MGTEKRERQKANRAAKLEVQAAEKQVERRQGNAKLIGIVAVLAILGFLFFFVFGGDDDDDSAAEENRVESPFDVEPTGEGLVLEEGAWDCPPEGGVDERTTTLLGAPPECLEEDASYSAEITTNLGSFTVTLDPENAPLGVNAFVLLSRYKYYDQSTFFFSDTGLGGIRGGAAHTNENNEPGPGFPVIADENQGTFAPGAVVLNANGTFDIVVNQASPGYDGNLGTVIGQVSPDSQPLAAEILALHADNLATAAPTDGGPNTAVLIESVVINQS